MTNPDPIPLSAARSGAHLRVRALRAEQADCLRLRELGLLEGRTLRIVCDQDPLICEVGECRFGVCRRLAHRVLVENVVEPIVQSA